MSTKKTVSKDKLLKQFRMHSNLVLKQIPVRICPSSAKMFNRMDSTFLIKH